MRNLKDFNLIVIASTYPRWPNDSMRSFVQDYVYSIAPTFKHVQVVVPHYKNAKHHERPKKNVTVTRFYYMLPTKLENVAYGEFKLTKTSLLKMPFYVGSELLSTILKAFRRPVVFNPHWIIPQGFVAVLLKPLVRSKVVISVHGADVYTLNTKRLRQLKAWVLKHADAVVCNSTATEAACQELYKRDYEVIPMGVDTSLFKQRPHKPAGDTFELLFVGRLSEKKGVQYLLEATKILKDRGTRVHATIVGDGENRSSLEEYVTSNDLTREVTFTGGVPHEQLAGYYAKADAFVGPSIEDMSGWKEAFGLVFAEASATGIPVVATSTGGIQDIIKDGVNGLMVPQQDAVAIADAIQRLRQDPALCEKLGTIGPAFIHENFSWQIIIDKYRAVFESLL